MATKLSANDVVGFYSERWTSEQGGRYRSGVEVAVDMLRAAGYRQEANRVWHGQTAGLPPRLEVINVLPTWPHSCNVVIPKEGNGNTKR